MAGGAVVIGILLSATEYPAPSVSPIATGATADAAGLQHAPSTP